MMVVRCVGCGAGLSDGVRFCPGCGTPRGVVSCGSCGAPSAGDRFCGQCGAPSGSALVAPLVEVPGGGRVSERRVTSVLFGDLVGFTSLSESRDAEDVRELLSEYFAVARTVVARYGGVVEKFIGDAVMAVWGVPVANEDDAERSVRAGLDLVAAVALLGERVGAPGLALRVGVVTGEVAVTLGATAEGMVAGDAVNTAARVQSVALPGTVWVDESTRSLTAAAVDYTDAGEHVLKGKLEPVRLFHARMVVAAIGGARRIDGLEAPFTGRDRHLLLVKELCHETAEQARPRLVLVTGVAGVGKSRLGWEFEKYVDGLSSMFAWHRGRCLSYGEGIAFWALAEVVRSRLGLTEVVPASVIAQRLDERLPELLPDQQERDWVRPRLAVLLGGEPDRTFAREDLFAAWTRFLERAGAGDPVIVVLDDLQHADEALLDFLDHLLATGTGAVHVLALARPELLERRPSLSSQRRVTVLHLEPLGPPAMATLIDGLVEGLTPAARDALVTQADGIPLFAVETVRALIDRDLVVPSGGRYVLAPGAAAVDVAALGAPASLHALVASRLDALPAGERHLISMASVLGLSFPRGALTALLPDTGEVDLDEQLTGLVRRELLTQQAGRFATDHGHYRFVQAVVRQVAYDTLSRRDRRTGHLAAATHLQTEPDAEELSALIAQHLIDATTVSTPTDPDTGDLTDRAVTLLEHAADRATTLGAFSAAYRHYQTALTCTTNNETTLRLHEGAADAALLAGNYPAALHHTDTALTALAGLPEPDPIRVARTAHVAGRAFYATGQYGHAAAVLRPHLDQLPDTPAAHEVTEDLLSLLAACLPSAEREESQLLRARQLGLAERLGDPLKLAAAWTSTALGMAAAGRPATCVQLLRGVADLGRAHQQPLTLSNALINLYVFGFARDLPQALEHGREAYTVSTRASLFSRQLAGVNLAAGLYLAGAWQECAQLTDDLLDPDTDLNQQLIGARVVQVWQEQARHEQALPVALPQWNEVDDDVALAWLQQLDLINATRDGDLPAAARAGATSVNHVVQIAGLDDDFPHLWPPAVLASLNAGLLQQAEQQISLVADAPTGLVTPLLAAELPRLQGLLSAAQGGDPVPQLRHAIDALGAFGAIPHQARTQHALATWLKDHNRHTEAQPLIAAAAAAYQHLGATNWLTQLTNQTAPEHSTPKPA